MTSLPYHFKPGTDVSRSDFVDNFNALAVATQVISEKNVDIGSIDYRHTYGIWKYIRSHTDGVNSYSTVLGTLPVDKLLLPVVASTETIVGRGNPVLVLAQFRFENNSASNPSDLEVGIYVGGTRRSFVRVYVEPLYIQTVQMFYMFEATVDDELIELKVGSSPTPANSTLSKFSMQIFSVRT